MVQKRNLMLLSIAAVCLLLLVFALYLQVIEEMQPCPLCILQRYAFFGIAVACILTTLLPGRHTPVVGIGVAVVMALVGSGVAIRHIYVKAHPAVFCGIDPIEKQLNDVFTAKLMPFLFQADGFCAAPYPPILGLSLPLWALIWFMGMALVLLRLLFKKEAVVL
jgi:disulfide bond formation protein DsbB